VLGGNIVFEGEKKHRAFTGNGEDGRALGGRFGGSAGSCKVQEGGPAKRLLASTPTKGKGGRIVEHTGSRRGREILHLRSRQQGNGWFVACSVWGYL